MREVVLDTETTGLNPQTGDRIVEIGAIELRHHLPTENRFHQYINPERPMPAEAQAIHGLSDSFLADKPVFGQVADDFLAFIGDAQLVIHNAPFDMAFLNGELKQAGKPAIAAGRVIDTLELARRKHPMGPNSLDALCKRYGIDATTRDKHGALVDSHLLASVYLELIGGRQTTLRLVRDEHTPGAAAATGGVRQQRPAALPSRLSAEERHAHRALVETLGENALWRGFEY